MAQKVITNGEIKTIIGSHLSFIGSGSDGYCPTYSQLINGSIVSTVDTNNKLYVEGYSVGTGTSYISNQLVCKVDIKAKYTSLDSIEMSLSPATLTFAGGSVTATTTATTNINIIDYNGNITNGGSYTGTVSPLYSSDQTWATVNGNTISLSKNESTATRNVTITSAYGGKTNSYTLTQGANSISNWTLTSRTNSTLSVAPTSMSFEETGGTVSYQTTLSFIGNYVKTDAGGTVVATSSNTSSISQIVIPTSYSSDNTAFTVTNSNVSTSLNSSVAKSGSITLTYNDSYMSTPVSTSISVTQKEGTTTDWILSTKTAYSLSVSPTSVSFNSDGGTTNYTLTLNYTGNYYKQNSTGGVVSTSSVSKSEVVTATAATVSSPFTISTNGTVTATANTGSDISNSASISYKDIYMASTATVSLPITQAAGVITLRIDSLSMAACADNPSYTVMQRIGSGSFSPTSNYAVNVNPTGKNLSLNDRTITVTVTSTTQTAITAVSSTIQPAGYTQAVTTETALTKSYLTNGTLSVSDVEKCFNGTPASYTYTESYYLVTASTPVTTITNTCDSSTQINKGSTTYVTGTTLQTETGTVTGWTFESATPLCSCAVTSITPTNSTLYLDYVPSSTTINVNTNGCELCTTADTLWRRRSDNTISGYNGSIYSSNTNGIVILESVLNTAITTMVTSVYYYYASGCTVTVVNNLSPQLTQYLDCNKGYYTYQINVLDKFFSNVPEDKSMKIDGVLEKTAPHSLTWNLVKENNIGTTYNLNFGVEINGYSDFYSYKLDGNPKIVLPKSTASVNPLTLPNTTSIFNNAGTLTTDAENFLLYIDLNKLITTHGENLTILLTITEA